MSGGRSQSSATSSRLSATSTVCGDCPLATVLLQTLLKLSLCDGAFTLDPYTFYAHFKRERLRLRDCHLPKATVSSALWHSAAAGICRHSHLPREPRRGWLRRNQLSVPQLLTFSPLKQICLSPHLPFKRQRPLSAGSSPFRKKPLATPQQNAFMPPRACVNDTPVSMATKTAAANPGLTQQNPLTAKGPSRVPKGLSERRIYGGA